MIRKIVVLVLLAALLMFGYYIAKQHIEKDDVDKAIITNNKVATKFMVSAKINELVVKDYGGNITIKQAGHVFVNANNVSEVIVVWKNYTYIFNETGVYYTSGR